MKEQDNEKILFNLFYVLKRHTDSWANAQFTNILKGSKSAYIPVMMCIDDNGISNNEIARELHVSKMGTSKIVTELVTLNLVAGKKNVNDGRIRDTLPYWKGNRNLKSGKKSINEAYR